MISYPPPVFEQQKSEILQRYKILRGDKAHDAVSLGDSISAALKVPFVYVALYKRYRERYRCEHGLNAFYEDHIDAYFARTHLSQGPFFVEDVSEEEYFCAQAEGLDIPSFKFVAGVPLTDPHGKRFGTLCVASEDAREFSAADLQLLTAFGGVVSNDICVRSAAHYAVGDLLRLEQEKCELFELATIDPLTKALNRRSFEKFANREFARFLREKTYFTTLMLDIDHFKRVNDEHGHAVGDQVIAKFVSVITKCVRQEDLVGRLGGEEFGILMPYSTVPELKLRAEAIRQRIAAAPCSYAGEDIQVSASIGVGIAHARDSVSSVLSRADNALYEAKDQGRDRIVVTA